MRSLSKKGTVLRRRGSASAPDARRMLVRQDTGMQPNEESLDTLERAGRLLADTAHDLRGSLSATREMVQIVADGLEGPVSEGQQTFLRSAVERCDEMHRLIESMLDADRLTAKAPPVVRTVIDVKALKESVLATLEPIARSRCITCHFGDDEMADAAPFGDAEQVRRILVNLAQNAIKASVAGSRVFIAVRPQANGEAVRFSVSDQAGTFLPDAITDAIERGQSGGGSHGLGLTIATQLAAAHCGRIQLATVPDRSTELAFHLPTASPRSVARSFVNWRATWLQDEPAATDATPRLLPPRVAPPRYPDLVAVAAMQTPSDLPMIDQVDRTIQSDAGYHELAYRTGRSSWVVLWDTEREAVWPRFDRLRGRIASLGGAQGVPADGVLQASQAAMASLESVPHRRRFVDHFAKLTLQPDLLVASRVEPRRTAAAPTQTAELRLEQEVQRLAAQMKARSRLLRQHADEARLP